MGTFGENFDYMEIYVYTIGQVEYAITNLDVNKRCDLVLSTINTHHMILQSVPFRLCLTSLFSHGILQ